MVIWIKGGILYLGIPDITAESFGDVLQAILNIIRMSLCEHLHRTIGQILNVTCEFTSKCYPLGSKAKSNALNSAGKDYMFCNISYIYFS